MAEPEIIDHNPKPHRQRRRWGNQRWIWGLLLIVVGVLVLLQNYGVITLVSIHNWWALLFLIPMVGSWSTAAGMYLANGRKYNQTIGRMIWGGILPLMLAIMFLFNLNWYKLWPIFVIYFGLSAVLWSGRNKA